MRIPHTLFHQSLESLSAKTSFYFIYKSFDCLPNMLFCVDPSHKSPPANNLIVGSVYCKTWLRRVSITSSNRGSI